MEAKFTICKNCGSQFHGNYCNECGEKVYTDKDKKISHIFEEAFHFITHLDGKFFTTLKLFFTKPGFVSKEYSEGKRKKYFKPVSLFLIAVVVYLLFPLLQGMNISFGSHLVNNNEMHIYYSKELALHKMEKHHLSEQQLAEKFDHTSPKFAKILLLVMLPLTALTLSLIFKRKKKFFFDHFILATELNTIFIFIFFLILPLAILLLSLIINRNIEIGDYLYYSIIQIVLFFIIVITAFRRFYAVSFRTAFSTSLLFLLGYFIALFIYRQIVFLLVMLFI